MNQALTFQRFSKAVSLFTFVALLLLWPSYASAQTTTLYVSPEGNDSWTGTAAARSGNSARGPFATIQRAQEEVRTLTQRGNKSAPVTVYLREGIHQLDDTVTFTVGDSGSSEAPILYANYPGEKPVISGGKKITGWQYFGHGLWYADLPEVKSGEWTFDQLYVEGERRQRARSPNQGYYYVDGLPHGENFLDATDRFQYAEGDIENTWTNVNDVEVVVLHYWFDVRRRIQEVDSANRMVVLEYGGSRNFVEKNGRARYFVDNVFEGLDLPGEWYLDRGQGRLFYMPMEGEDPTRLDIYAPLLTELFVLEGTPDAPVEHISFEGLRFTHTQWNPHTFEYPWQDMVDYSAAVVMLGARNIEITGCTFRNLGSYAIDVWQGSRDIIVAGNLMEHLGGGGVRMSGPKMGGDPRWRTGGNSIEDNTIRHGGLINPSARGILLMHTGGNRVTRNELSHLRYSAIQVGYHWGWGTTETYDNFIGYNHIHDIGGERDSLSDLGAIYLNSEMPGTVVSNNLIHDVYAASHLAFGIYLDGHTGHVAIENNVVFSIQDGPFLQNFGMDNLVSNNIFAHGRASQVHVGNANKSKGTLRFEQNIVLWDGAAPLLAGAMTGSHLSADRNTYFRTDGGEVLFGEESLAKWRQRGQDVESVIADPMVRLTETGVVIDPSSPALAVGFRPIDLGSVGPSVRQDEGGATLTSRRRTTGRGGSGTTGSGD